MKKLPESFALAVALLTLSPPVAGLIFANGSWTHSRSPTGAGAMWWSVRVDNSPFVYLGGYIVHPTARRLHIRNVAAADKETGQVVWEWHGLGEGVGFNNIYGLASDENFLYGVGYEAAANNLPQAVVQKHDKSSGTLQWIVRNNPTPFVDAYYRAFLHGGRLYAVGITNGEHYDPDCPRDQEPADWIISAFDAGTGRHLWDRTLDFSDCYDDEPNGIHVDATGIYVAGFGNWRKGQAADQYLWVVAHFTLEGQLVELYQRPAGLGYGIVSDGEKLYVAGVEAIGLDFYFRVDRMGPNPLQLEAFDLSRTPSRFAQPFHMALTKEGGPPSVVVVGGEAQDLGWLLGQWRMGWRMNRWFIPSLTLDQSFGEGGALRLFFQDRVADQAHDVSIDPSGQFFYLSGCTTSEGDPPFGGCVINAGPRDTQTWARRSLATGQ